MKEVKADPGPTEEPQDEEVGEEDFEDDVPIEGEKKILKPQASQTNEQEHDKPVGEERLILKPKASESVEQN